MKPPLTTPEDMLCPYCGKVAAPAGALVQAAFDHSQACLRKLPSVKEQVQEGRKVARPHVEASDLVVTTRQLQERMFARTARQGSRIRYKMLTGKIRVRGGQWIREGADSWRLWKYPAGSPVAFKALTSEQTAKARRAWSHVKRGMRSEIVVHDVIDHWFETCEGALNEATT